MHVVSGGIRALWEGCALHFKWDHETHAAVSDFWPRLFELTSLFLSRGPIFLRDKNTPPLPPGLSARCRRQLKWDLVPRHLCFEARPLSKCVYPSFPLVFFSGGDVIFNFCLPPSQMSFHCRSSLLLDEEAGKRRRASKCFFGQMVFISSWFLFLHSGATPSPRRCWSICSGVWGAGTEKLNYARKWRTRMLQNQY